MCNYKPVMLLLTIVSICFSLVCCSSTLACTSVCLTEQGYIVFGNNLDWFIDDALLIINKRNVRKRGVWGDHPPEWVSKYGSITTNLQGSGFPNRGMNEVGLVIGEMWLGSTEYPDPDARPWVNITQWIQYQLDTCATVEDVLATDKVLRIGKEVYKSHFFVCDATGACAVVEWLDGKLCSNTGNDVTVKALTNSPYVECLARENNPCVRFSKAAEMLENYTEGDPVEYVFSILRATRQHHTRWSLVFDVKHRRLHYFTERNPTIRSVNLLDFDLSCQTPVQILDINAQGSGDVTQAFQVFSHEENARIARTMLQKWAARHGPVSEEYMQNVLNYYKTMECLNRPILSSARIEKSHDDKNVHSISQAVDETASTWQYLGQIPPGDTVQLFAPEIMQHQVHSAPTFNPDGNEMYWSTVCEDQGPRRIVCMTYRQGKWEGPVTAPFSGKEPDDQPFMAYDGSHLVFPSKRPSPKDGLQLWSVSRKDKSWGTPQLIDIPISLQKGQWTPSLTRDNTLCFSADMEGMRNGFGIYLSQYREGHYQTPQALPSCINRPGPQNWTPWIAPDGSFILFASGRQPKEGAHDIFISYRDGESWAEPINLGPKVNTRRQERFPGLSPDGKYLFFTRHHGEPCYHDLYWIEAKAVLPHLMDAGDAKQNITVTFIGNAGFLVEYQGKKILVDALFGRGESFTNCMNPSDDLLQQMENAQPPFDDVDLVAATHHHRDHFTAVCVAKHLLNNPQAQFVSTADAVDLLKADGSFFNQIKDRIHGLKPEKTKSQQLLVNGIGIQAFGSSHSPPHDVNNLVMVFDVNGCTMLHTGDTSAPNRGEYAAMALPEVDLGIIHKGFFLWSRGRGKSIISDIIKPDHIVLGHVYIDEVEKLKKRLPDYRKQFPRLHLIAEPLGTLTIQ